MEIGWSKWDVFAQGLLNTENLYGIQPAPSELNSIFLYWVDGPWSLQRYTQGSIITVFSLQSSTDMKPTQPIKVKIVVVYLLWLNL